MPRVSPQNDTQKTARQKEPGKLKAVAAPAVVEAPFWKVKPIEAMSTPEWESLCDGCGRCCLVKLEDEDTGEVHFTDLGCKLLDAESCRCSDYRRRRQRVRDCIKLTPAEVRSLPWLPPTCAYKLLADGKELPWWHPLVSGTSETVHEAGVSVQGRVAGLENEVKIDDYPDYIVSWPRKVPESAKPKKTLKKAPKRLVKRA